MNANDMLFRCSSIGDIMTDPRGKSNKAKYEDACAALDKSQADYATKWLGRDEMKTAIKLKAKIEGQKEIVKQLEPIKDMINLSASCLTVLNNMYGLHKYHKVQTIENKFTRKGNRQEETALSLLSMVKDYQFDKNTIRLNDSDLTGEVDTFYGKDIRTTKHTLDTKASWNWNTFRSSMMNDLDPTYFGQGQGYLKLTGADEHTVAFCLVNTPLSDVDREIMRLSYNYENMEMPLSEKILTIASMVYDSQESFEHYCRSLNCIPNDEESRFAYDSFVAIPAEERVHEKNFKRDDEYLDAVSERIKLCRSFMNQHPAFFGSAVLESLITE